MLLTRPHNVCTLDTSGRIVGNVPLAWSQDDCIAVATSSYVMLYDLNPFKNISHSRMQFKTQIIPNPTKLGYDGGIGQFISSYDEGRILSSRDSVTPNIDIYLTHLDPSLNQSEAEEIKNSGFKAVGFSPLGCSKNEGVLLAFLTCSHRLQIFSRKSDGTNIEWTMDQDLSDILVNILEKNDGEYPDISFPEAKSDIRRAWQLRYAACVDNFVWSSIYSVPDTNEKHVYLLASTRMNYILIWKLTLPFGAESSVEIIGYIKAFDDGTVSSVASLPNLDEGLKFCVGNTDGRIIGIAVDHDGQEFSRNVIWGDQDELSVHCMDWKSVPEDESYNCLIAAKGFMIVGFKICDLQEISYSVVNHAHSLPVGSVGALDDSAWISASREGNITKIK